MPPGVPPGVTGPVLGDTGSVTVQLFTFYRISPKKIAFLLVQGMFKYIMLMHAFLHTFALSPVASISVPIHL